MMADQKGIKNPMMRRACRVYLEKQAELLPSDKSENVPYVFSERFNTRMYDAIHSHSFYLPAARRRYAPRKFFRCLTAAVLMVCLLIAGASFVPAKQMRGNISASMIVESCGVQKNKQYIQCSRKTWAVVGVPNKIKEVYLPTFAPEGYELKIDENSYHPIWVSVDYYRQNDPEPIGFTQSPLVMNLSIEPYEPEENSFEYVTVGSKNGVIYRGTNGYWYLYWNDGLYLYELCGKSDRVSPSQLIQMAESVQKISKIPHIMF